MRAALLSLALAATASALAPHPRLILTPARLADVAAFTKNSSQAGAYYSALLVQADWVVGQPVVPVPPANSTVILTQARTVLNRVYITALAYRLSGNETYAERAAAEVLGTMTWSSWNIMGHALDTGELSHATAIGLDWLYDYLTVSQRATIAAGIVDLAMTPFRDVYSDKVVPFWATAAAGNTSSNWCLVTNAGAGIGALGIAGEAGTPSWVDPAVAHHALELVKGCAAGFGPAGSWWEGPIYHGYGARYFVPYAESLLSATGDDGGLWALDGVTRMARYQMHALGAQGAYKYFNWGDAEEGQETLAMLLTAAVRSGDGAAAWTLRNRLDNHPPPLPDIDGLEDSWEYAQALLYFTPMGTEADLAPTKLDAYYPSKKLAFLRSNWSDPASTFVGLKGVNSTWNHGDLDGGSFVYTYKGVRWAYDMGADNYDLPDYFGPSPTGRFKWYRKNNFGHNTLTFDSGLQDWTQENGVAEIVAFTSTNGEVLGEGAPTPAGQPTSGYEAIVQVNLTRLYAYQGLSQVVRTLLLPSDMPQPRSSVIIRDSWDVNATATVDSMRWALHTQQNVTVSANGQVATLTGKDSAGVEQSVVLFLRSAPMGCGQPVLKAIPVDLPYPQYSTKGTTRLQVVLKGLNTGCGGLEMGLGPAEF